MLLRASLLDGDDALDSWRRWIENVDFDKLPVSSFVLLPLLYDNLRQNGVKDPLLQKLKGWYTRTWFNNETLLRRAAQYLNLLRDAGIEAILLKGASMTIAYYRDPGLRPMGDVDVLVRPDRIVEAASLLRESGLFPTPVLTDDVVRYMHSVHFADGDLFTMDLHWRLLWEFGPFDPVESFWHGRTEVEIHGAPTYVLNPADQLFQICVHGARLRQAPLRWVADAITILQTSGSDMDFDRLLRAADLHRLILPLRRTLGYLGEVWPTAIPETVVAELHNLQLSRLEGIQRRYEAIDHTRSMLGKLPRVLVRYLRITRGVAFTRRLLELPRFLVFDGKLQHVREIPREVFGKAKRRVGTVVKSFFGR